MNGKRQHRKQSRRAAASVLFSANSVLILCGVLRPLEESFTLEVEVMPNSPASGGEDQGRRLICLTCANTDVELRLEEWAGASVGVEGRWIASPKEPNETGVLRVTSVWKQPSVDTKFNDHRVQ